MKKSVVIIEDDVNIAKAEKLILQDKFEVHLAHDGESGLDLVRKKKPDIVVLDLMLPRLHGFELCKRIKAEQGLKNTKIVMVTAKNEEKDEAMGMNLGADDYIMKPFEPFELVHVVNQVLRQ